MPCVCMQYMIVVFPDHTHLLFVTHAETWYHHFDPESKMQSKQWKHSGSHPLKKFKRVHSPKKVMASIFWDSQEVSMIDYLEQGRTINGAYLPPGVAASFRLHIMQAK